MDRGYKHRASTPYAPQSCTAGSASGPGHGKALCAAVAVSRAAVTSPPITACPHLANEGTESPAGVFQHSRAGFGTHSTQPRAEARRARAAEPGEPESGSLRGPLFLLLPHHTHSECSISPTPRLLLTSSGQAGVALSLLAVPHCDPARLGTALSAGGHRGCLTPTHHPKPPCVSACGTAAGVGRAPVCVCNGEFPAGASLRSPAPADGAGGMWEWPVLPG